MDWGSQSGLLAVLVKGKTGEEAISCCTSALWTFKLKQELASPSHLLSQCMSVSRRPFHFNYRNTLIRNPKWVLLRGNTQPALPLSGDCFWSWTKYTRFRTSCHSVSLSVDLAHKHEVFLKAEEVLSQAQWLLNLILGCHTFWNPYTEFSTAHVHSNFSFNHSIIHPMLIIPVSLVIAFTALTWNHSLLLSFWEHGAQGWVRDLTEDNILFLCSLLWKDLSAEEPKWHCKVQGLLLSTVP